MYVIVKHIKNKKTGKVLPIILIDSQGEIWEFDTQKDADKMKDVFQNNSDSGHFYEVKKI